MTRRQWAILGAAAFLAVSAAIALKAYRSMDQPGAAGAATWVWQDFRDVIYYPAVAMREGVNPYDTGVYPQRYPVRYGFPLYAPHFIALNLPFSFLAPGVAEAAYYCFSLVLIVLLAWLALRVCSATDDAAAVAWWAFGIVASRAAYIDLVNGQPAVALAIGSLLALEFSRTKPWLAAFGLALAAIKPTYGVPLAFLMLCRGDFRVVLMAALVAGVPALAVCAVLASASGGLAEFGAAVAANPGYFKINLNALPLTSWTRIDLAATLAKLLEWAPPPSFSSLVTLVVLSVSGVVVFLRERARRSASTDGLGQTLIYLTMLVAIYHQPYDMLVLAAPIVSLAVGGDDRWEGVGRNLRWSLLALMVFAAFNYLGTWRVLLCFEAYGVLWRTVASLTGVALAAAFAISLGSALTQGARAATSTT